MQLNLPAGEPGEAAPPGHLTTGWICQCHVEVLKGNLIVFLQGCAQGITRALWQWGRSHIQGPLRESFWHCVTDSSAEVHSCLWDPERKTRLQWSRLNRMWGCPPSSEQPVIPKVMSEPSLTFWKFPTAQNISCTWP